MKIEGYNFDSDHVNSKKIRIGNDSFHKRELTFLQKALTEKYGNLLKTFGKEKFESLSQCIEAGADLFQNPFLLAIAKEMAKASEQGYYISCEGIAKILKVDFKNISNKIPFIRQILKMLGIEIETTLIVSEDQKTKTIAHKLKFA